MPQLTIAGRSSELYMIAHAHDLEELLADECPLELTADTCPLDLLPAWCLADLVPHEVQGPTQASAAGTVSGTQSTTRNDALNEGCSWVEDETMLIAELRIPGLRGQPAGCLAAPLATSRDAERRSLGTLTVMAFGRVVWACVLAGAIVPDMSSVDAEDGDQMMPVLLISVRKLPGSSRWDGFIGEVDSDCLLS